MTRVRQETQRKSCNVQKQYHVRTVERQITILTTVRTVGTVLESLVGTRSTAHDRSKPPGNIWTAPRTGNIHFGRETNSQKE